jgi:hypothetical protein
LDDLNIIPLTISIGTTFWAYFQFYNTLSAKEKIWRTVLSYIYIGLLFLGVVITVGIVGGVYLAWKKHYS